MSPIEFAKGDKVKAIDADPLRKGLVGRVVEVCGQMAMVRWSLGHGKYKRVPMGFEEIEKVDASAVTARATAEDDLLHDLIDGGCYLDFNGEIDQSYYHLATPTEPAFAHLATKVKKTAVIKLLKEGFIDKDGIVTDAGVTHHQQLKDIQMKTGGF